jgi:hypothetical protein
MFFGGFCVINYILNTIEHKAYKYIPNMTRVNFNMVKTGVALLTPIEKQE